MKKGALFWPLLALLWLLGVLSPSLAQRNRTSVRSISATAYWGSLEIHSRKIEYFRGTTPFGVGVDWSWRFVSEKAWQLCKCYPSLGVSINYRDFGHPSLGEAVSTLFFVEPELAITSVANLSLRAGMGISYLSNPFDAEKNPLNLTYSTHISFPLMIGLVASRPLGDSWGLSFSATFQHLSNGGTSQPNLGINYGALGLGIRKTLDRQPLLPPAPIAPFNRDEGLRGFRVGMMTGLKEPEDGPSHYGVLALFGDYMQQFGRINGWTLGGMAELDNSRRVSEGLDRSRYSVTAGHRFLLGRFDFGQTAGFYLWSGHVTKEPWYQYYTIDYRAWQQLSFGVGLKAHGKVAEFLGIRLLFGLF